MHRSNSLTGYKMDFSDSLVRLEAAATLLAIPAATLRQAKKQGRLLLPIIRVGPRTFCFRASVLQEVLDGKRMVMGPTAAAAAKLAGDVTEAK